MLCDEPTGNLDQSTARSVAELLFELHEAHRNILIVVTHSEELAARFPRRFELRGGPVLGSLIHYWRMNIAVVLSCAVAVAVLTGALVVGDSVRGSLRALTVDRLGNIDHALVAATFFREDLAAQLESATEGAGSVVPAIIMPGGARNPSTGARASAVGVQGVGDGFDDLFDGVELGLDEEGGGVAINSALARELGLDVGDALLISLERPGEAPRETLLGSTETADVVRQLRLTVTRVLDDRGIGRFSLQAHQSLPLVAFTSLERLQDALGQPDRANALLVDEAAPLTPDALDQALSSVLDLDDLGLELTRGTGWVALSSRDHILSPALESEIGSFAASLASRWIRISTYIANSLDSDRGSVPYSAITALDTSVEAPFGPLPLVGGGRAPALREGEVLVNTFVAEDLEVVAGDTIRMTYYEVGPREELVTREVELTVRGSSPSRVWEPMPASLPTFPAFTTPTTWRRGSLRFQSTSAVCAIVTRSTGTPTAPRPRPSSERSP